MASPLINVTVKTLSGEILSVEVDPSLGLRGVAQALYTDDPDAFPVGLTTLSYADPDVSALADGVLLLALVTLPTESIVRVDPFDFRGQQPSYRFRIAADRSASFDSIELQFPAHSKLAPQYLDVCYYTIDRTFRLSCNSLTHCGIGKRAKRVSTVLKEPNFTFRRDKVGLEEFDDEISRLPGDLEKIDSARFTLSAPAIKRIDRLITQWIQDHHL